MKKAYLHTIEVSIAVILTFIFVVFVVPRASTPNAEKLQPVLQTLSQNNEFRSCAVSQNRTCIEEMLIDSIPHRYSFVFDVGETVPVRANLPAKDINTESVFIAGNTTAYKPVIVKIYVWQADAK